MSILNKILFISSLLLLITITDAFSQLRSDLNASADSMEVKQSQLIQSLLYSRHTELNTINRISAVTAPATAVSTPAERSLASRIGLNLTRDILDNRFENELFRDFRPATISDYNRFIINHNYSPYSRFINFQNSTTGLNLPVSEN